MTMNNSLAEVHPELVSEWSEKNLPLTPDDITFGSNKKVWWKGTCGHEWEAAVKKRTINKTGCPYCSHNKVLAGFNDLATLMDRPEARFEKQIHLRITNICTKHLSVSKLALKEFPHF